MSIWHPLPFTKSKTNSAFPDETLSSLYFERPKVVLERGVPGSWDGFGVRDPALLVDERGYLYREEGSLVMYYTGSRDNGLWQGTGRAVSYDEGLTWHRCPDNPVLAPKEGAWDSGIATTPWVLRDDDGLYRLYYRGGNAIYKDAVGIAVSQNGIDFERASSTPILRASDFVDIPQQGRVLMAVINVVRILDGWYLLTFEGFSKKYGNNTQIFGAISDDGENFCPLNNGYPIFTAEHVQSWPVLRVANPRITVFENSGIYMLAFNGSGKSGFYSVGLAFTRDFENWWEHPCNPLISPSGTPPEDPFSGRIEGGVIVKEDIEQKGVPLRMFLMAIPRSGPSHKGSVIGLAQGWVDDPRSHYNFHTIANQPSDISIEKSQDGVEILNLRQSSASKFPSRVHFNMLNRERFLHGISLDFSFPYDNRGSAFIVLSEYMDSAISLDGIRIGFSKGRLYLWPGYPRKNIRARLKEGRTSSIFKRWSWFGWKRLGRCEPGVWKTLEMKKSNKMWALKLDDREIVKIPEKRLDNSQLNNLSIQSHMQPISIRNLRVLVE